MLYCMYPIFKAPLHLLAYLNDSRQASQSPRDAQTNLVHRLLIHHCGIEGGVEVGEIRLRCQPEAHHTHHDTEHRKRTWVKESPHHY